jgi:type III secretion system FlhB-like substrate exporter
MQKKTGHQTYAIGASSALSDKLKNKIVEKGYKYDVALFQNPDLTAVMCDTAEPPCMLSPKGSQSVAEVLSWLIESQNAAQLSSD